VIAVLCAQVDHAWTFAAADARAQLAAVPGLLRRVAAIAGVRIPREPDADDGSDDDSDVGADSATDGDAEEDEEEGEEAEDDAEQGLRPCAWRPPHDASASSSSALPDRVLAAAWRLCGHYRCVSASSGAAEAEPTWFLCDEFGAAMRHSARPSLRLVPFLFASSDGAGVVPFSLAWAVRDVAEGGEATRDYLEGVPRGRTPCMRAPLLACWFRPRAHQAEACAAALRAWREEQAAAAAAAAAEQLQLLNTPSSASSSASASASTAALPPRPLRVFTDLDWVTDHLCRPEAFCHVSAASEADILWLKAAADPAAAAAMGARHDALLNQFPGEECLVRS
jgi:hypothetical protein